MLLLFLFAVVKPYLLVDIFYVFNLILSSVFEENFVYLEIDFLFSLIIFYFSFSFSLFFLLKIAFFSIFHFQLQFWIYLFRTFAFLFWPISLEYGFVGIMCCVCNWCSNSNAKCYKSPKKYLKEIHLVHGTIFFTWFYK